MGTGLVTELIAAGQPRHVALKAAASASGVRQYAIAAKIGISEGYLAKLLAGRKPLDDDTAARIEAAIVELAA